jgi:hypothetical protein
MLQENFFCLQPKAPKNRSTYYKNKKTHLENERFYHGIEESLVSRMK